MTNRTTPEEKLEKLRTRRDQLNARIQKETAKARASSRKEDTRRKIIAGAIALEHAKIDPAFAKTMADLLRDHVKESDRALFDLT